MPLKKMYQYTIQLSVGNTNTAQHKRVIFRIVFMLKQKLQ